METTILTDLQLVDKYITDCRNFVNPFLYNQIKSRGLYDVINRLNGNIDQCKALARERMIKIGRLEPDGSQIIEKVVVQYLNEGYTQAEIPTLLKAANIKPNSLRTVEAIIKNLRERHGANTMFHLGVILTKNK